MSSTSSSSSSSGKKNDKDVVLVLDQYEECSWKKLPNWVKENALILGWTKQLWDNDGESPCDDKDWVELTTEQQEAAKKLGYTTSAIWDDDDSSSSSSSDSGIDDDDSNRCDTNNKSECKKHHHYNVYCVQLYTETPDYKFRIDELKGLSMYVNRTMKADEIIIQSPVGPSCQESLFYPPAKKNEPAQSTLISPERQDFANAFLEWQDRYGTTQMIGTTVHRVTLTLEDFQHAPSKYAGCVLPSSQNKSAPYEYIFGALKKSDVVLVEFVSPPSSSYSLPPERRFEILPYDEFLEWDEEDGYTPDKCQRPPTMHSMHGRRYLEIPSHFTNHACGSTATSYDCIRLEEMSDGKYRPVAPSQPSWVQYELDEYVKTHVMSDKLEDLEFEMATHRALEPGDEVTSDYALWHWSNEDHIPNGPSCFNPNDSEDPRHEQHNIGEDALRELCGDWMDPWFHCCCADKKCHSKHGFRGVKHFPLEEQKRLYWVCSPWIKNQIEWKLYQLEQQQQQPSKQESQVRS